MRPPKLAEVGTGLLGCQNCEPSRPLYGLPGVLSENRLRQALSWDSCRPKVRVWAGKPVARSGKGLGIGILRAQETATCPDLLDSCSSISCIFLLPAQGLPFLKTITMKGSAMLCSQPDDRSFMDPGGSAAPQRQPVCPCFRAQCRLLTALLRPELLPGSLLFLICRIKAISVDIVNCTFSLIY